MRHEHGDGMHCNNHGTEWPMILVAFALLALIVAVEVWR